MLQSDSNYQEQESMAQIAPVSYSVLLSPLNKSSSTQQ